MIGNYIFNHAIRKNFDFYIVIISIVTFNNDSRCLFATNALSTKYIEKVYQLENLNFFAKDTGAKGC